MKFRIEKKQPVPLLVELLQQRGWTQTDGEDWQLMWGAEPPEKYGRGEGACYGNHFRKGVLLANKASLGRLLTAARRRAAVLEGETRWDFFPATYELPAERAEFAAEAARRPDRLWIAKPAGGTHGDGQFVLTDPTQAPTEADWIVQEYVARPHLLDGRKYTLRLYVLLTSLSPLVAHIYDEGLIKRSTVPYSAAPGDLSNRLIHLTNSDVQRLAPDGPPPAMSLSEYRRRLAAEGADLDALWRAIRHAAARVLLASRDALARANPPAAPSEIQRFDLLGLDFIVDEHLKPWLLEVNTNPSMRVETPAGVAGHAAERRMKTALLENVLHLAGPLAASRANGSPPGRDGGFERLFPTPEAAGWDTDWYPHSSDVELFARLGMTAPVFPRVPLPAGAVLTSEGLIAFAPGSAQLLAFNESATAIALLSDEGRSRDEIRRALTQQVTDSPPPGVVLDQIDDVLKRLWNLRVPAFLQFPPLAATPPEPVAAGGGVRCYALGPVAFRVRSAEAALLAPTETPLEHLQIADDGSPMHRIDVAVEGNRLVVRSPIEEFDVPAAEALPTVLHSALLRVCCRLPTTSVAFHAAAVGHEGAALILAGRSGAGKTTLAAALMGAGFTFFSDEAAILDVRFRVRPAPVSLGLRPDVLSLLEPFIAAEQAAAVRQRRNGSAVHFLPPGNIAADPLPVGAIVFPRIAAGEPTRLEPIGPVAALTRLGDGGLALPRPLEVDSGRALVGWLQRTPRFELTVGTLAGAVSLLREFSEASRTRVAPKNARTETVWS